MLQQFNSWESESFSLSALLLNLIIGVVLSLVLRWHFRRFGSTLSNRDEFAQVFPFILLTTVLIISVVKSSLALSLGLVGALSIVRFRTPIKEPEELAYLFIAIAMGLGLGANQTLPTVVAGLFILAVMAVLRWTRREIENKSLHLSIDWQIDENEHSDRYLEHLNEVISKHVLNSDLRRFDVRQNSVEATYLLDIASTDNISALIDELRRTFPTIGVTFLDQNQLPSV
ncbi:MAG TPA: DUF4956 domain-containing protein [Thioploca sp.]|nr:MAG: DUF4956 domain-containing protein [Gammaproteobacteria bacterium]HDN27916.1 DUF4956 domain-containing protein [Thioploca sp.]